MNCLGPDRTRQMVAEIMRMEKCSELLPRIVEHMEWMANTVHQAHHTEPECMDKAWKECPHAYCKSTAIVIKGAHAEVLQ